MENMTKKVALQLLEDAKKCNPGPWIDHSLNVANAAYSIATHTENLSPDRAYILGTVHDIGRRNGFSHLKHTLDGYKYLKALGYESESIICLTHSFPIKNIESYSGLNDCSRGETIFIKEFLENYEYNDYDRLLQLCDAIASKDGFCVIEQRLIDVAIRNGVNALSPKKWMAFLNLKKYFDSLCNKNIYEILDVKLW